MTTPVAMSCFFSHSFKQVPWRYDAHVRFYWSVLVRYGICDMQ